MILVLINIISFAEDKALNILALININEFRLCCGKYNQYLSPLPVPGMAYCIPNWSVSIHVAFIRVHQSTAKPFST